MNVRWYVKSSFLLILISVPLYCDYKGSDLAQYSKPPILFVHGYGMKASGWEKMISSLKASGYPPLFLRAVQLYPDTGGNIRAAEEQIASAIERFLDKVNTELRSKAPSLVPKTKVDIVAHSMGALSARWYAAKLRPDRVRVWISLGGANHGTDVLCKFLGQGARDCCPAYSDSGIQYDLNGLPFKPDVDETPYGMGQDSPGVTTIPPDSARAIFYFSIRTSPDNWIKPETSPILDGAGGCHIPIPSDLPCLETSPGNFLMTNGVGHDQMLEDAAVIDLVKTILSAIDR